MKYDIEELADYLVGLSVQPHFPHAEGFAQAAAALRAQRDLLRECKSYIHAIVNRCGISREHHSIIARIDDLTGDARRAD